MRKIFLFLLIATFLFTGVAYAASVTNTHSYPAYSNAIDIDGNGEIDQPPMFIKKVRYGCCDANDPHLQSGTVVAWDTNSADGVTISACIATTDVPCGVLVTDVLTQDSSTLGQDDNWGYMAVGGYCMASVDTSEATTGKLLCLSEQITAALPYFGTQDLNQVAELQSRDCGVLLTDTASDGYMKVWLNFN